MECKHRCSRTQLVLVLLILGWAKGKNVVEITDFWQDCENGKPMISVDLTDLEMGEDDEGNPTLMGKFVFEADFNDPTKMIVSSERLRQGTWTPDAITRDVANMCPLILEENEVWYAVSSQMNQTTCPFKKGHVESFSNVLVNSYGVDIPHSFIGDWRIYIEVTTEREDGEHTECFRMVFTIKEI
ncbi:uncharacterized protein LOC131430783 [Malaya genurostris]|uniref:uncharacterized protein LOC131430783 n=1 Tax=Malaya genurostris TaxID=325434 RepID=UPI0026F39F8E|nr:uncharacterized protein LOC131430783 [Malaya genurostris]